MKRCLAVVACENHNPPVWFPLFEQTSGLDAVHSGQVDIEQHHICLNVLGELERLVAIRCLADDEKIALVLQKSSGSRTHHGMVIDKHDAYHLMAVWRHLPGGLHTLLLIHRYGRSCQLDIRTRDCFPGTRRRRGSTQWRHHHHACSTARLPTNIEPPIELLGSLTHARQPQMATTYERAHIER